MILLSFGTYLNLSDSPDIYLKFSLIEIESITFSNLGVTLIESERSLQIGRWPCIGSRLDLSKLKLKLKIENLKERYLLTRPGPVVVYDNIESS